MITFTNTPISSINIAEFIDILSDEFTGIKGFGVYAFLSFRDIENLYSIFLVNKMPARAISRTFVKNY